MNEYEVVWKDTVGLDRQHMTIQYGTCVLLAG